MRGWPKLCMTTFTVGKRAFIYIAQIAEMAAPRLCPVVSIPALGYFSNNILTFSLIIFSKNR